MANFTEVLSKIIVASTQHSVTINSKFTNISTSDAIAMLQQLPVGNKDGSHFLRTGLMLSDDGACLPRSNCNAMSMASLLILDCDKRIDKNGEILEGAPDPHEVSQILRLNNIGHILYGSYSHYVGDKGNRYRILVTTNNPYNQYQLPQTIEALITLINAGLNENLLVNATENNTWTQPWYYPRKPANNNIDDLYLENLGGSAIEVIEAPPSNKTEKKSLTFKVGELSPIDAFNEQYPINDLLIQYGYKMVYSSKEYDKWLSPDSSSGIAGITVKDNKFYSHHGSCIFNDGYWHDAFDLMRAKEGITLTEAVKKAAKNSLAPDGCTVDDYNKKANKKRTAENISNSSPIPHAEILKQLLEKIPTVNFRKVAELSNDNDKLKRYHFYIIAVETILETAKKHHWGMCRNHDFIYLFNGAYWSFIDKDDLKAFLGAAAEKMGMEKFYARDFNFREQLYKQFIALAHLPKPEQPKNVVFINLQNGTFEITPMGTRLKPFDRNDFLTHQLPFSYVPNAEYPLFQAYLSKVLPDINLQKIMAEYIGYIFIRTSTLKLEQALLLYGNGANGKSVFYEIIRHLLGEQNTSEYSLQSLTDEKGYQRAMIANKLLNYASEINGKVEASVFKQLVSGEPVEARLPHGAPFIISNYAKLIFNCNELPATNDHTNAYFRRFLIIPFNVTIPDHEQDKQLPKKIIDTELSGVFNWVLGGLKRLLEQKKFTESEAVHATRAQYERESDSVRLFLTETGYLPSIENFIAIKELYREYRCFCQENGYHSVSSLNFKRRLEHAKISTGRRNIGNVAFVSKDYGYSQAKYGE